VLSPPVLYCVCFHKTLNSSVKIVQISTNRETESRYLSELRFDFDSTAVRLSFDVEWQSNDRRIEVQSSL